jgi:hypothetical protein
MNQLVASQLQLQESGQGLDEQKSKKKKQQQTNKHWESTIGLKKAKGLIPGPSARKIKM